MNVLGYIYHTVRRFDIEKNELKCLFKVNLQPKQGKIQTKKRIAADFVFSCSFVLHDISIRLRRTLCVILYSPCTRWLYLHTTEEAEDEEKKNIQQRTKKKTFKSKVIIVSFLLLLLLLGNCDRLREREKRGEKLNSFYIKL